MNTIITYKIVYVDEYGDIQDRDFNRESDARAFATKYNITDFELYEVRILGSITKL